MELYERIKYVQDALGLNQTEFSSLAGLSGRKIGNWYYRKSNPSGKALEQISKRIHAINPSWLLKEEGPPLLLNKVWTDEEERRFRATYEEFVFLHENAFSMNLVSDFFPQLVSENLVQKMNTAFAKYLSAPIKASASIFRRAGIPYHVEFFAIKMNRLNNKIAIKEPLDSMETYMLSLFGGIDLNKLRGIVQTEVPENVKDLKGLYKILPIKAKVHDKIYRFSGVADQSQGYAWQGIRRAFEQAVLLLEGDSFPAACPLHNRLYWTKCPACSQKPHDKKPEIQPPENTDENLEAEQEYIKEQHFDSFLNSLENLIDLGFTREQLAAAIDDFFSNETPDK